MSARLRGRLARGMAALRRKADGVALIEFAISLPILILLYLGGYQISDAIACNRKVTITTRAIADLVAQNTTGTTDQASVANDLAASIQVMAPYPATSATVRVTEVYTDAFYRTTVQWSQANNGTGYTQGTRMTIPFAMRIPGSYHLLAEVTYAYQPAVSFGIVGPLTLSDQIYMLPRNSNSIDCNDCG